MSSAELLELVATESDDGNRVDSFIAANSEQSRNAVQRLIGEGCVAVNGSDVSRPSSKVRPGDVVAVRIPEPEPVEIVAQDIPLEILHEDDEIVVVNKPTGMVVHPAPGHPDGTLVNAIMHHVDSLSGIGGELRPGIVHRIDKDTSGVLVVAKNDAALRHLQSLFAAHDIERQYLAVAVRTNGPDPGESGTFNTLHGRHPRDRKRYTGKRGSRHAITHYEVERTFDHGALLLRCTLETGRTHQIRVHLSEAGMPILGDPIYGGRAVSGTRLIGRAALHAATLGFIDRSGNKLRFEASLPDDLEHVLDRLEAGVDWRR